MNRLKTMVLLTAMTLILVFVGRAIGGRGGMTMALLIAFVMNFVMYWFSDKIVLKMYGAKEATEADQPGLHKMVGELATRAELPMPKVYIMESDQPNAFATGRNPKHGVVAVTRGIMNILTPEELSGVLAHELTHIKNRDILVSTIAATMAGAISYLAQMAQWGAIFGGGRRDDDGEGGSPFGALIVAMVAYFAAMIVQMAISRSREYMADEGGAKIAGNPLYLANALRKLDYASKRIPMEGASQATSHMFIVNPFSGAGLMRLFSTHPPIEERIEKLEAMKTGRL